MTPKIPSPCIGASEGAGRPGGTGFNHLRQTYAIQLQVIGAVMTLYPLMFAKRIFKPPGADGRHDEDPTGSGHRGLAGGESSDQTRDAKCG